MREEEKKPYKLFRVGGRSFPVYLEHDDGTGEDYMAYPDFEEFPEYTDDGRPFAMSAQESCPHAKPKDPGDPPPGDCGGCGWFYREQTPIDLIGICMCCERLHGTGYSGGHRDEKEDSGRGSRHGAGPDAAASGGAGGNDGGRHT